MMAERFTAVEASRYFFLLAWMAVLLQGGGGVWRGAGVAVPADQFDGCEWQSEGGVINLKSLANTDGTPR